MMNPSLILCPLDFTASAKSALVQALALASRYDAELHVLYVRTGRLGDDDPTSVAIDDAARSRVWKFVEPLNPKGVRLVMVVDRGDPATAIVAYARRRSADLLVLGARRRRSRRDLLPAFLRQEIAHRVTCPTLTVPSERTDRRRPKHGPFAEILCPVDFSPASSAGLRHALTLAQQSGGRLTLLHVLEGFPYEAVYSGSHAFRTLGDYRALVAKVSRELKDAIPVEALNWCDVETRVVSGVAHRAILSTASEIKADLIVTGVAPRSGIDQMVFGSTTRPVRRRATCPVLTVPVPMDVLERQALNVELPASTFDQRAPATIMALQR